jgi:hypothetical protein
MFIRPHFHIWRRFERLLICFAVLMVGISAGSLVINTSESEKTGGGIGNAHILA